MARRAGKRSRGAVMVVNNAQGVRSASRPTLFTVTGGGTRSEQKPAYHLVPGHGARRTAIRFGLGAEIHGAENWKMSCNTEQNARVWCQQAFDHMMDHALKMGAGENLHDDHLGAIGWAVEIFAYCENKFGKPWTQFTS